MGTITIEGDGSIVVSTDLQMIRAKLLTLLTVNVFQPVDRALLVEYLKSSIDTQQIDCILDELIKENRVTKESDRYRLTYHGGKTIIPGKGRILRDIQRMKYLVKISKQRGGS